MNAVEDLAINEGTYQWCVRALSLLENRLGLKIRTHGTDGKVAAGQIFIFNHFARFEAIVPQYLIYRETGAHCRAVAASELFAGNARFAKFLTSVGAVPNNLEGLLPFLAAEILRGRKVVIFPEGGMIKNRRVIDAAGEFDVFSPSAKKRRKHHKVAAAISVMLAIFKKRILSLHAAGETSRLARWVEALGLQDSDALLQAARTPTVIVPANITFFPIRASDNFIHRAARFFAKDLRAEFKEELLIEGNILFKETDMDIRFGPVFGGDIACTWWERRLLDWGFARVDSLERLFGRDVNAGKWLGRLATALVARNTRQLRDRCMREMYAHVTANLSHLTSRLMLQLVDRGVTRIDQRVFHETLYRAVKRAQTEHSIFLHDSLGDPETYDGLHTGRCRNLQRFLELASSSQLLEREHESYRLLPKLSAGQAIHRVRIENLVQVCANEIAPLPAACRAVDHALKQSAPSDRQSLAKLLFDDELRGYLRCKTKFAAERYREINRQETATESGEPFLLLPDSHKDLGIVLVHGFLASPAEVKSFGETLQAQGYPVIGVRLKGHGTSPWDLRDRTWQDWLSSVARGYEILSAFTSRICLIGFSTGGGLALKLAAQNPPGLAGVAAVSVPMKLRDKNFKFAPVIHGANKLAEWTSSSDGVMPFRPNDAEHPNINYRNVSIAALVELKRLIDELNLVLPAVRCPAAILQGSEDKVVDPKSGKLIFDKIGSAKKDLHWIGSERHGILHEDIGETRPKLMSFVDGLLDDLDQADQDMSEMAAARQLQPAL